MGLSSDFAVGAKIAYKYTLRFLILFFLQVFFSSCEQDEAKMYWKAFQAKVQKYIPKTL